MWNAPQAEILTNKCFAFLSFPGEAAIFILATWGSIHYDIHMYIKMQWNKLPQIAEMAKFSADGYFLFTGYASFGSIP